MKTYGLAAQIDWNMNENITLTSLSSWRETEFSILTNNDGLPSNYSTATQVDDGRHQSGTAPRGGL